MGAKNAERPSRGAWTVTDTLRDRIAAFARNCVAHGDMTPMAERMLLKILQEEKRKAWKKVREND